MLFDLRGAGRRTTVKVVYLTLAILMGGGLILFGIGGDVSGGLVDAITDRSASSDAGESRYREREAQAERATQANPQNATAWATLARARYQLSTLGDNVDDNGQITAAGRAELQSAAAAWERHLALDPAKPDDSLASLMVRAYSETGLNEPEKAVQAQEIITEVRPGESSFGNLAILAYQAGQTRKGDLARKEALRMADKADRQTLKSQLDAAKQQALQQQVQDATQQAPPTDDAGGGNGGGGGGGGSGGGGSGD
jgi:tetratricopeptide (TPR) repeat protein